MVSILNIIMYVVFMIFFVYAFHQSFIYIRDTHTNKITKNIYYNQVDKYNNLADEIKNDYIKKNNDKIDMLNELDKYVEQFTK